MRLMAKSELMTREAAKRLGESERLVRLWCKQGRFPHARLVAHPRGDYWVIPERDLKGFDKPKPGRMPARKTFDESLPSGSVIHWSQRDAEDVRRVSITCGGCGARRMATTPYFRRSPNWTGLCRSCSKTLSGGARRSRAAAAKRGRVKKAIKD